MKSNPQNIYRPGFTLIELLVVIAIIGLLAALLFPVVGGSLSKGRTTASMNNMKQIHLLVENYVNDNKGRYPIASEPDYFWRRAVWESNFGTLEGDVEDVMASGAYAKVMWCPVMVKTHGMAQHPGGRGSYGMNAYFNQEERFVAAGSFVGSQEPYIMAGKVNDVNATFGTNEEINSSDPEATSWQSMAYVYGSGKDLGLGLYVDGHVEQISAERGRELNDLISDYENFE